MKDSTAQVIDSSLIVGDENKTGWAVYSWCGMTDGNLPAGFTYQMAEVDTEFWIGIGNYTEGCWEFQGPLTSDSTGVVFSAGSDYSTTEGCTCIAVVVPGGHQVTVDWVNLVTTDSSSRIHVDANHTGTEDGSAENPYNTIQEAVDVAETGDVIVLAPGLYEVTENITLPHAVTIEGAGACRTTVTGGFLVDAPVAEGQPVVVNGVECGFVEYAITENDKVPIRVSHCVVQAVEASYPPVHDYEIRNSVITGDPEGGAVIDINGWTFDTSDGNVIEIGHAEGASVNTVMDCRIEGGLKLCMGSYATNTISGNTVFGNIEDLSGICTTTISHNRLYGGSIIDRSGGAGTIEDEIIEYNILDEGMIKSGSSSVTIRGNIISWTSPPLYDGEEQQYGIDAQSGYPTNIIDNVVSIAYESVEYTDFWSIEESAALNTRSASGVISGNILSGGAYGIVDFSGAESCTGNEISVAHIGIVTAGAAYYDGNYVHDCVGTGMIITDVHNVFSNNVVQDNGGDGIYVPVITTSIGPSDFGGGDLACSGGNIITGNTGYGLRIEFESSSVATVFAENNYWGVTDEAGIADCIHDGNDEAGLALVDFVPFLTAVP